MAWIKAHLVVVIVSAVSVLSLVMMVLGLFLSDVGEDLAKDTQVFTALKSLNPVNEDVIRQARQQADVLGRRLDDILGPYREKARREPLLARAFAVGEAASQNAAYDFQDAFRKAQRELIDKVLQAGDPPSAADVEAYAATLKHKEEKADHRLNLGLGDPTGIDEPARRSPFVGASAEGSSRGSPSAAENAQLRVECDIVRARQLRCYANPNSLDQWPEITDSKEPPSIDQMWYAQASLWIQQDVLGALASLNDRVAQERQAKDEPVWVAHLPVKRLIKIEVGSYVPPAEAGAMGGVRSGSGSQSAALLPGVAEDVFTGRGSQGNVDVIHFYLQLVVDAGRLPEVVDAISGAGFYTPLAVSYEADLDADLAMGYVYGPAPTLRVTLVYEACMLRSTYDEWMPATVKQAIVDGTAGSGRGESGGTGSPGGRPRPSRPRPRGGRGQEPLSPYM